MGKEKDIFEDWDKKTVHERRQMLANAFKQSFIHYMNQNALEDEDDKEVDVRVLTGIDENDVIRFVIPLESKPFDEDDKEVDVRVLEGEVAHNKYR